MKRIAPAPIIALASGLALTLAACGGGGNGAPEGEEVFQEAVEQANPSIPIESGPDLAAMQLGPRIQGPEGDELIAEIEGASGQIRSYVACPGAAEACDPDQMGGDIVYTYVHEVTPGERASVFRMTRPAYGFTGTAGFDRSQADAALGASSELTISCVNDALVWAVNGEQGWTGPITVYWQSTLPPEGPQEVYQLIAEGDRAPVAGPFPPEGSTDGCG